MKVIVLLPLFLSLALLRQTEVALNVVYLLAESPEQHFKEICKQIDHQKWLNIKLFSRTTNRTWVPFCNTRPTLISRRHYKLDIVASIYETKIVFFTTTKMY